MKKLLLIASLFLLSPVVSQAGCIGPEIMGQCKGAAVPYDTGNKGKDLKDMGSRDLSPACVPRLMWEIDHIMQPV